MTTPPTLRVDRLGLRNFRCFAECTIALHPQLTVTSAKDLASLSSASDGKSLVRE